MDEFDALSPDTLIHRWLDTITCSASQDSVAAQKALEDYSRLDWDDTPTPPQSATPSQSNASSNRSPSRASTNRSASPVKRSTLELLKKPLYYVPIENDPTGQLPDDVVSLYDKLVSITLHREIFLPITLCSELEGLHRRGTIRPSWYHQVDGDESKLRHTREFHDLCQLQETARICKSEEAAEVAWNIEVHVPLLELAFDPFPSLRRDLLVTARISKPFLPEMQDATIYDYTRAKMVDLGVRIYHHHT